MLRRAMCMLVLLQPLLFAAPAQAQWAVVDAGTNANTMAQWLQSVKTFATQEYQKLLQDLQLSEEVATATATLQTVKNTLEEIQHLEAQLENMSGYFRDAINETGNLGGAYDAATGTKSSNRFSYLPATYTAAMEVGVGEGLVKDFKDSVANFSVADRLKAMALGVVGGDGSGTKLNQQELDSATKSRALAELIYNQAAQLNRNNQKLFSKIGDEKSYTTKGLAELHATIAVEQLMQESVALQVKALEMGRVAQQDVNRLKKQQAQKASLAGAVGNSVSSLKEKVLDGLW